jgi:hypothetical protein
MAIGARKEPPVDATHVIPRHVRTMLGKVSGRPEIRRAMQPLNESFDNDFRAQLEAADPRENRRVEELGAGGDNRTHALTLSARWTRVRRAE